MGFVTRSRIAPRGDNHGWTRIDTDKRVSFVAGVRRPRTMPATVRPKAFPNRSAALTADFADVADEQVAEGLADLPDLLFHARVILTRSRIAPRGGNHRWTRIHTDPVPWSSGPLYLWSDVADEELGGWPVAALLFSGTTRSVRAARSVVRSRRPPCGRDEVHHLFPTHASAARPGCHSGRMDPVGVAAPRSRGSPVRRTPPPLAPYPGRRRTRFARCASSGR